MRKVNRRNTSQTCIECGQMAAQRVELPVRSCMCHYCGQWIAVPMLRATFCSGVLVPRIRARTLPERRVKESARTAAALLAATEVNATACNRKPKARIWVPALSQAIP